MSWTSKDIENLALVGRDTTELLKVLPGATTVSSGLTHNAPMYNDLNTTVQQSAIGNGININGAVNRGGTALLSDGANIIDPGNMASSVSIINPEMTAEVSVQASNFGADTPFGPVVVSTISKSGTERYHGEAYFVARNSVLNANDWQSNHQDIAQGPQPITILEVTSAVRSRRPTRSSSSGAATNGGCKTRATRMC